MKINDLIFGELLKRRFTTTNGTRVWDMADSKLWYLTPEQSKGFITLEHDGDYDKTITQTEFNLIKNHLSDLMNSLVNRYYNIIDLGCGDGTKALVLINELRSNFEIRYCPIDISAYMVKEAFKLMSEAGLDQIIKFKWNVSDFENLDNVIPLLQEKPYEQNIFLLLGNTFGNFDCDSITHSIYESMTPNDCLIVGNSLIASGIADPAASYRTILLEEFLVKIIEQIGLTKKDVTYDAKFENSRVECFFTVNSDKEISHLGKKILFKAGDIILVAYSYRYHPKDFEQAMKKFFSTNRFFYDNLNSYVLAFCKK